MGAIKLLAAATAVVVLAATAAGSGATSAAQAAGGITVTGEGAVTVAPDLALLELGVEAQAGTITAARAEAATAMTRIVEALTGLGVAETDIQTRSFRISPRYDYVEETDEEGRRQGREILVGYRVTNLAAVKVRDIDRVGEAIDAAAQAGGDATRIRGVSFTVEDTQPYMAQLRERAFADALAKARHYAALAGVGLGKLTFLQEIASPPPAPQGLDSTASAPADDGGSASPVGAGRLELTLTIQAAFEIT